MAGLSNYTQCDYPKINTTSGLACLPLGGALNGCFAYARVENKSFQQAMAVFEKDFHLSIRIDKKKALLRLELS